MSARFITVEGMDGAGKSTHLPWIAQVLECNGERVCMTREPGGTELGEHLRALLLDPAQKVSPATETLLMFAARQQHLDAVIRPALSRGEVVVCDRFTDATFAYQGWGRGIDPARLRVLEDWVHGDLQPDLTVYFDVPPQVARSRLDDARAPDRFEQEQADFFARVRTGYLERARQFPARIKVVDATQSIEAIRHLLLPILGTS